MSNFFAKLFDSSDRTVEAHIVLPAFAILAFIAFSGMDVILLRHAFNPDSYGQGVGWLLSGGGIGAIGQGMQNKMQGPNGNPR
ncbi:MAG: hypothetical protein KGL39_17935 [Patescibacteria group bacterium]|nr:hypothetical protein [Patescibacteria group bacterium]